MLTFLVSVLFFAKVEHRFLLVTYWLHQTLQSLWLLPCLVPLSEIKANDFSGQRSLYTIFGQQKCDSWSWQHAAGSCHYIMVVITYMIACTTLGVDLEIRSVKTTQQKRLEINIITWASTWSTVDPTWSSQMHIGWWLLLRSAQSYNCKVRA